MLVGQLANYRIYGKTLILAISRYICIAGDRRIAGMTTKRINITSLSALHKGTASHGIRRTSSNTLQMISAKAMSDNNIRIFSVATVDNMMATSTAQHTSTILAGH